MSNAVQLYVSMRYEATFLEKTIFKDSHDENETHQTSTLQPTNAENLVRGCNQCRNVAKIPHPSIHIQSPKPGSPRTEP
ncbi:hypothetical protein ACTXT7_005487 [Hymenolepis weldensis]